MSSNLKNGIYNVASKKISKYRLLLLIKKIYAKNTLILPSSKFKIDRSLNGTFFKKMTNIKVSSWEKMIIDQKMNYLKKLKFMNIFKNKILLVTGGTGSFGNAVIKILKFNLKEIRIFSRDEKTR